MDNQQLLISLAVVALGLAAMGMLIALLMVQGRMRRARSAASGGFPRARRDGLAMWEDEGGSRDRRVER